MPGLLLCSGKGGDYMRELFVILRGNYRNGKKAYVSLFLLMFVVSLSLATIITSLNSSKKRVEELMEKGGFGDLICAATIKNEEDNTFINDELFPKINACEDLVDKVDMIPILNINAHEINGKSSRNTQMGISYDSPYVTYNIYDTNGKLIENPVLSPGEIIVPVAFKNSFDCKEGDTYKVASGDYSFEFKVKGFFEDPYMGSFLMGIKTVLLNESDIYKLYDVYDECVAENGECNFVGRGVIFNVFKSKSCDLSDTVFEQQLNKKTEVTNFAWISLSHSQSENYMLMFTNIFSGIMAVFAVLLVIITIIVLNHNISSSIESGYTNYGVLKAIGVKNSVIRKSILLGYTGACALGAIVGIPASVPVIAFLNDVLTPVTGLYVRSGVNLLPVLAVIFALLLMMLLFIEIKLIKLNTIAPIKAISNRTSDNSFSSILKLPISKKLLNLSIAYRQFVAGKKQYITSIVITGLLGFFLLAGGSMYSWTQNPESIADLFDCTTLDFSCVYKDADIKNEVEEKIKEMTEYESYNIWNRYFILNEIQTYCYVCSDPAEYISVFKGRSCTYDNEMLITEFVAKEFGLKIGDEVTLSLKDNSAKYIVSGIYQCANDAGKNIAISGDGYERLTGNKMLDLRVNYRVSDKDKITEIENWVKENYAEDEASIIDHDEVSDIDTYKVAIVSVTVLIYILTGIFVGVTIILICDKVFAKEKKDYGTYKAMGFRQGMLRRQFVLRFVIVSLIGSLLGCILFFTLSDAFFGVLFASFGVSNFAADIDFISLFVSIAFTAVLYALFSYIASRKIKKIQPRILISE